MNIFFCADFKSSVVELFKKFDFVYFAEISEDGVYSARVLGNVDDDKPGLRVLVGDFSLRVVEKSGDGTLAVRFRDVSINVAHGDDCASVIFAGGHAELFRDGDERVCVLYASESEISGSMSGTFNAVLRKAPKAWKAR